MATILGMLNLPEEVHSTFDSGEFAVCQTPGSVNGTRSDMGTEKTVITDSKGRSGIVVRKLFPAWNCVCVKAVKTGVTHALSTEPVMVNKMMLTVNRNVTRAITFP